eukprot:TRINITY_DN31169_c0_g1_i1.p1 TRINITY_DN31169_c0_g1~~TRINITY_DN31169_c0_g1_i1.p1  ORF type:complete len:491 (+),score=82.20 TRINITY_DN31169_c0_g1_i1:175-1647(+)
MSASTPPEPKPNATSEEWRSHPRLQRHLQKFMKNASRKEAILQRYSDAKSLRDRQVLLRYMCHVGSWVALLPLAEASEPTGVEQRSPVSVLTELLLRRGKGTLTPWLCGILRLVKDRLGSANTSVEPWKELSCVLSGLSVDDPCPYALLPAASEQQSASPPTALEAGASFQSAVPLVAAGQYACRTMQQAIATWQNLDGHSEQRCRLEEMQSRFEDALEAGDMQSLSFVFRGICAALLAPRKDSDKQQEPVQDLPPMGADGKQELGGSIQKSLRSLFLKCSSQMDLSDPELQPAVHRVRSLISEFEESSKKCVSESCDGKQWFQIKGFIFTSGRSLGSDGWSSVPDGSEEPQSLPRTTSEVPQRSIKSTAGGVYTPSEKLRGLEWVHQGKPVALSCSKCHSTVSSSWYFTYQGKTKILIPNNGHFSCNRARYLPPPGVACKADAPNTFPCEHGNKTAMNCKECLSVVNKYNKRRKTKHSGFEDEPDAGKK